MARFKFPLAKLLRLRESTRDERRGQLAEAHRAEELIVEKRQRLDCEVSELKQHGRRASTPGRLDLAQLREVERYESLLRSQQRETAQQHRVAQAEVERRLQTLVEANRQVRLLETLRRRQLERYRLEKSRRETKEMDEAAARCTAREDEY
ncbi:MAG: flagellar export protein FliJ [Planctomycetes bacterium]|nr:flagellar export protein FliJ [Planctomycetota bacterium]